MKSIIEILDKLDLKAVFSVYVIVFIVVLGVGVLNYNCMICLLMEIAQGFIILSLLAVIGIIWQIREDRKRDRGL